MTIIWILVLVVLVTLATRREEWPTGLIYLVAISATVLLLRIAAYNEGVKDGRCHTMDAINAQGEVEVKVAGCG